MTMRLHGLSVRHIMLASSVLILLALLIGNAWKDRLTSEIAALPDRLIQLSEQLISLQELRFHTVQVQQYYTDASLTGDADSVEQAQKHVDAALALLPKLESMHIDDLSHLLTSQAQIDKTMTQAYLTQGVSAGNQLMKQANTGFDALSDAISDKVQTALEQQSNQLKSLQQHSLERRDQLQREDRLLLGGYVLIIVVLLLWATYRITLPLKELEGQLNDLAAHSQNLAFRLKSHGQDEFAHLAQVFNQFMSHIDRLIGSVQGVTIQSHDKMESLMEQTNTTLQSMGKVQNNTDALASAISQMASTIQNIARSTEQAKEDTRFAQSQAAEGEHKVDATIQLMRLVAEHIEQSADEVNKLQQESAQIGDILQVIRTISEQTNLLALNAAIEAARAGEAGRGFAVVADEVRHLAKRTQEATVEIQQRIEALQNKTNQAVETMHGTSKVSSQAVEQAADTGQTLEGIVSAISRINELNAEIATAAEQQAKVAEETHAHVASVSDIAHQTFDLTQQSNQHARDVNLANQQISLLSCQFQVSEGQIQQIEDNELVSWNESFLVNVDELDHQHQGLFSAMNRFYQAIREDSPDQVKKQRLSELLSLAQQHFADEERYMQRMRYPNFEQHKQVHIKLLTDLDALVKRVGGSEQDLNMEIIMFLKKWLIDHIFRVDKLYAPDKRH